MALAIKSGAYKPVFGEFVGTVRHVFPAENTQRQHLLRCQLRTEVGVKVLAHGLSQEIAVISLHEVVYNDSSEFFHSPVPEHTVKRRSRRESKYDSHFERRRFVRANEMSDFNDMLCADFGKNGSANNKGFIEDDGFTFRTISVHVPRPLSI